MKAEKDKKTGKWLIQYRFTDWKGIKRKSTKRGFNTKREAEEWARDFLVNQTKRFDMRFEDFLNIYYDDMQVRLREHTMINKRYIIDLKILPYFKAKKVNEIQVSDIRKWQNELLLQGYAPTYLKTVNNQLNAIFNYAVRYYDLNSNPCTKAGSIGKSKAEEMNFWTKEEFMIFSDCIMDKRLSYLAFLILFWTGMRIGELLALTFCDIDLKNSEIKINKSYQRLRRKDVITPPKTPKSNRVISIPSFLVEDIKDYENSLFDVDRSAPFLPITKSFLEKELQRGIKLSGLKRVRIHDLRHSHASLLVEMGFMPLEIANRLGHEKVETTLNTYSHLYPNKQSSLANELNRVYKENI